MTAASLILCTALLDWGAVLAFLQPLDHRSAFWGRAALCFGVFWSWEALLGGWPLPLSHGLLVVLALYLLMVGMFYFCGRIRSTTALYCGAWSTAIGLLAREVSKVCTVLLLPAAPWACLLLPLLLEVVVWATLGRILPVKGHYKVGPRQLLSALLIAALMAAIYQITLYLPPAQDLNRWLLLFLCQVYAATVLYLQNALFRKSALQQEVDTMNLLWHQQKSQYDMAKADVELINRKCHDLKHQVAALRAMDSAAARKPYLQEIETLVEQYDSIVKTGNEVLDTILTQKSRYAEAQHIRLNCVAEGSATAFMDPVDLYTMLGNALDNAIEYVEAIQEEEKRIIDVLIHTRQRFLTITVTNPLHSVPVFEGGLPVTTKAKNGYHGYGIKSIRRTAEKYGGFLTIDTAADSFTLRLLLPLPQTGAA